MLKLSRHLLDSSTELFSLKSLASAAASDLRLSRSITTQTGIASAMPKFGHDGKPMARTFAPYSIFKGKAALSADPSLPMFTKLESGDYRVERRGSIMLTFRPAIGERKYDWEKKQVARICYSFPEVRIFRGCKDLCLIKPSIIIHIADVCSVSNGGWLPDQFGCKKTLVNSSMTQQ